MSCCLSINDNLYSIHKLIIESFRTSSLNDNSDFVFATFVVILQDFLARCAYFCLSCHVYSNIFISPTSCKLLIQLLKHKEHRNNVHSTETFKDYTLAARVYETTRNRWLGFKILQWQNWSTQAVT